MQPPPAAAILESGVSPRSRGRARRGYSRAWLRFGVALTAHPCAGRANSASCLRPDGLSLLAAALGTLQRVIKNKTRALKRYLLPSSVDQRRSSRYDKYNPTTQFLWRFAMLRATYQSKVQDSASPRRMMTKCQLLSSAGFLLFSSTHLLTPTTLHPRRSSDRLHIGNRCS